MTGCVDVVVDLDGAVDVSATGVECRRYRPPDALVAPGSPLDGRTPRRVNDHGGAHLHGAINVHDQVNVDVNLNENSLQPFIISVEAY